MLTISKPLSASQAQTYHAKEFTSAEQNYWKRDDRTLGEWHGKLADKFGITGGVDHDHVYFHHVRARVIELPVRHLDQHAETPIAIARRRRRHRALGRAVGEDPLVSEIRSGITAGFALRLQKLQQWDLII